MILGTKIVLIHENEVIASFEKVKTMDELTKAIRIIVGIMVAIILAVAVALKLYL